MKIDKHTIFSIVLLIVMFAAGFIVSAFMAEPEWACPSCSFDAEEITTVVNDGYFEAVVEQINSAEDSIHMIMFSMKAYDSNNSVQQLQDALIAAKKRGVDVKILLDQSKWSGSITSTTKNNEKALEYLEEGGIEVKMDSLKQTTHVKMILIDGRIVIVGSTNWTYSALERNNEVNVMIKDKGIVQYFENYFDNLWGLY